ncbi:MAG: chalcone isomerase family protein [Deltaproteobacteria bacterium]|nr:chalcone isomerase family protein [Deltaproteobacteria bacterium]
MKNLFFALMLTIFLAGPAAALEVAGVTLEPALTANGHTLKLNGYGIRKRFFVKVYIGSLYSERRLATAAEALADSGDKVIRMNFLHSRVEKGKITEAFSEGFANNSPELAGSAEAKRFLSFFSADFSKGDVVDLSLGGDGTVSATHNGRSLGTIKSARLAHGILAIYLGERPADEALKTGMLGK